MDDIDSILGQPVGSMDAFMQNPKAARGDNDLGNFDQFEFGGGDQSLNFDTSMPLNDLNFGLGPDFSSGGMLMNSSTANDPTFGGNMDMNFFGGDGSANPPNSHDLSLNSMMNLGDDPVSGNISGMPPNEMDSFGGSIQGSNTGVVNPVGSIPNNPAMNAPGPNQASNRPNSSAANRGPVPPAANAAGGNFTNQNIPVNANDASAQFMGGFGQPNSAGPGMDIMQDMNRGSMPFDNQMFGMNQLPRNHSHPEHTAGPEMRNPANGAPAPNVPFNTAPRSQQPWNQDSTAGPQKRGASQAAAATRPKKPRATKPRKNQNPQTPLNNGPTMSPQDIPKDASTGVQGPTPAPQLSGGPMQNNAAFPPNSAQPSQFSMQASAHHPQPYMQTPVENAQMARPPSRANIQRVMAQDAQVKRSTSPLMQHASIPEIPPSPHVPFPHKPQPMSNQRMMQRSASVINNRKPSMGMYSSPGTPNNDFTPQRVNGDGTPVAATPSNIPGSTNMPLRRIPRSESANEPRSDSRLPVKMEASDVGPNGMTNKAPVTGGPAKAGTPVGPNGPIMNRPFEFSSQNPPLTRVPLALRVRVQFVLSLNQELIKLCMGSPQGSDVYSTALIRLNSNVQYLREVQKHEDAYAAISLPPPNLSPSPRIPSLTVPMKRLEELFHHPVKGVPARGNDIKLN